MRVEFLRELFFPIAAEDERIAVIVRVADVLVDLIAVNGERDVRRAGPGFPSCLA